MVCQYLVRSLDCGNGHIFQQLSFGSLDSLQNLWKNLLMVPFALTNIPVTSMDFRLYFSYRSGRHYCRFLVSPCLHPLAGLNSTRFGQLGRLRSRSEFLHQRLWCPLFCWIRHRSYSAPLHTLLANDYEGRWRLWYEADDDGCSVGDFHAHSCRGRGKGFHSLQCLQRLSWLLTLPSMARTATTSPTIFK
jgi:hypothetical protein